MLEHPQPDFASTPHEEVAALLNAAELNTVLDMLAVMETAEELKMLECLTLAQKRQVWNVTPQALKIKLHQLKELKPSSPVSPSPPALPIPAPSSPTSPLLPVPPLTASSEFNHPPDESAIAVGVWVVLKAKPELSKAELIAIFEVVEVQDGIAYCKAEKVGGRRYPVDWLILYPRSPNQ